MLQLDNGLAVTIQDGYLLVHTPPKVGGFGLGTGGSSLTRHPLTDFDSPTLVENFKKYHGISDNNMQFIFALIAGEEKDPYQEYQDELSELTATY